MHIHFSIWMSFIKTFKDYSDNISGVGGFLIFAGEIWVPHLRIDMQNLGIYGHNFFNNTTICVLLPYSSYYYFVGIISSWKNLGAATPHLIGEIWVPPSYE